MTHAIDGSLTLAGSQKAIRFKVFVSYNHAADGRLAPELQRALQRFARPWNKGTALRIFRDETDPIATSTANTCASPTLAM